MASKLEMAKAKMLDRLAETKNCCRDVACQAFDCRENREAIDKLVLASMEAGRETLDTYMKVIIGRSVGMLTLDEVKKKVMAELTKWMGEETAEVKVDLDEALKVIAVLLMKSGGGTWVEGTDYANVSRDNLAIVTEMSEDKTRMMISLRGGV